MKWCCGAFEGIYYNTVKKNGYSIYLEKEDNEFKFVLNYTISFNKEYYRDGEFHNSELEKFDFIHRAPIYIKFCPFCGKKLERFYKKTLLNDSVIKKFHDDI